MKRSIAYKHPLSGSEMMVSERLVALKKKVEDTASFIEETISEAEYEQKRLNQVSRSVWFHMITSQKHRSSHY